MITPSRIVSLRAVPLYRSAGLWGMLLLFLLTGQPSGGQETGKSPAAETTEIAAPAGAASPVALTVETVQERRKTWEAAALDPAVKQSVLAMAVEAETQLQQKAQAAKDAQTSRARAMELPARAAELRKITEAGAAPPDDFQPAPGADELDSLEVAAARSREAVEKARQAVTEAQELPQQRAMRRRDLTAIVNSLTARQANVRKDPPVSPAAAEPAELAEARNLSRTAAQVSAQARLDAAQAELAFYDAEEAIGWPALTQAAAEAELRALESREQALQERLKEARSRSASSSLAAATEQEAYAPESLRPVLEQVTRYAGENRRVVEELIPSAEARLERMEGEIRRWTETAARTREKIRRLGASGVIGVELRQQRQSLPAPAKLRMNRENFHDELTAVEYTRLSLEEELAALPPAAAAGVSPQEMAAFKSRRDALTELLKNYGQYFNMLIRLDEADRQFTGVVAAHRDFIHGQILWTPSAMPAGPESSKTMKGSLRWLVQGIGDGSLISAWWAGVRSAPWTVGFIAPVLLVFLFMLQRRARRELAAAAVQVAQPDSGFPPTARALVWTLLLALPWPALLWFAAQPLRLSGSVSSSIPAWAAGMEHAALVLLGLEMMRRPLRAGGLAEAHFQWPPEHLRPLRGQLRRLTFIIVPAILLGTVFRTSDQVRHDSAERLCLLIILLVDAWWLHRVWKRGRSIRRERLSGGDENHNIAGLGWWAGHVLSIGIPVALGALALRGYLYTAEVLTERLAATVLAAAAFLMARALFFRWYRLHRRRLRSARAKQIREVREATRAAAATAAASAASSPAATSDGAAPAAAAVGSELAPDVPPDAMSGPDIDEIGQEMRQLVEVIFFFLMAAVMWLIWADVLPAAQKLSSQPAEILTPAAAGDSSPALSANPLAFSPAAVVKNTAAAVSPAIRTGLADILLAVGAGFLTFMAARRIPGALQFSLSSQINLDPGLRFALGTITRYIIIIAGTVFILNSLGMAWSHVQWLAAALTVGLGFGLQEIFANFFSGLIILFERPIRPGDVVTIDNVTGTVTRIQIRATIIRTGDYTEYIVPNREFITGKLLNWTRSDTVNRMTIEVGISYKSDIPKALEMLQRIVTGYPTVLKDPAPAISCEGFMENSVKLVVRYYLSTLDHRLSALTDIHCLIAKEFAGSGIEMSIPRRDLHLRSLPPGWEVKPVSEAREIVSRS